MTKKVQAAPKAFPADVSGRMMTPNLVEAARLKGWAGLLREAPKSRDGWLIVGQIADEMDQAGDRYIQENYPLQREDLQEGGEGS